MNETKDKILDTAERLFAQQGYPCTSLRQIIADAKVNLAAVHYHFGSKEELLSAVVARKAAPINRERMERLAEFERVGAAPTVEQLLRALLAPMFHAVRDNPEFGQLMGRLMADVAAMPDLLRRNFGEIIERFGEGFQRALPNLTYEELAWRVQFIIGSAAVSLRLRVPIGLADRPSKYDPDQVLERIVTFAAAGLRAPVGMEKMETKQ